MTLAAMNRHELAACEENSGEPDGGPSFGGHRRGNPLGMLKRRGPWQKLIDLLSFPIRAVTCSIKTAYASPRSHPSDSTTLRLRFAARVSTSGAAARTTAL